MQFKQTAFLTVTLTVALALPAQQTAPAVQVQAPQNSTSSASQNPRRLARISGGVMAGQRLSDVAPVYPEEARASRLEGTVVLHVIVGPDGAVEEATPISGPEVFRQSAADAVRQWTYKRYLINGQPVEVETTVTVNFKLF